MMTQPLVARVAEMRQQNLRDEVARDRLAEKVASETRLAPRASSPVGRWARRVESALQRGMVIRLPRAA